MTEEKFQQEEISRYQKYGRLATMIGFAIMALLDVALWVVDEVPDNLVVLVALLPMLIAVVLAYQYKTQLAIWLFGVTTWGSVTYLTLTNPQSYQEPATLAGRILFPVLLVVTISWLSLEKLSKRLSITGISVAVAAFVAFFGHLNDTDITLSFENDLGVILTGTYLLVIIGFGYLIVRNFPDIIRWFNNISLRYKLTAFVLLLLVPTVVISSTENIRQAGIQVEENVQKILEETGIGLIASTEIWLEENVHFLEAISQFPGIVSMDADHQKPVLEAVDVNNPHVFLVQTTDTQGINVARNDDAEPKDYSDRVWVQGPLSGQELTFQSLISRTIGEPALAVSVPVREESGAIVGVLQIALEFSELTNAIGAIEIGESGVTYIVDANNVLIAHTDQTYFEADELFDFSDDPAIAALRGGESGIFHYVDETGVERMAYLGELDKYGWAVVVSVDEAEISAPIVELRNGSLQGLLLILIPVVVLVWFILGRTVKPITELAELTQQYSAGNFNVRADVRSEDEIGRLSQAFNQMAEEVGHQTIALAERAREMEASQRVTFAASERTTPDDFLDLMVNLIVDQFDVYHSQIYMIDEERKNAVLSKSTGYAGRVLLQRKHHIPLERESLVTRCIQTGEPVLVGNTIETEGWLANDLLPYTQSELVVPVKIEGEVIGALDIQSREPNRFTNETVPVFESMIEQVAFLYQNNELLENIEFAQQTQQEFVKQLETASQVAGQLTSILDPTQLLDQAVSMLQSNFNFYHAHIYLVDETDKNLVVQSGSGHVGVILKERGHSIPVDAEKSFVATAFREKMPVRVADTTADPNWLPNPLLPETRSEMAVPLITRGQVIGVLDIQAEETNRFTAVDEDTMLTLAGQLATSVDTARLFTDVEHAAERDRMRFEIAEALAGNPSEDEVWDALMEKMLGENVSVNMNKVVTLEGGEKAMVVVRSESTNPDLKPSPLGLVFKFSENPAFQDLKVGEFMLVNDLETYGMDKESGLYQYLKSQGIVSFATSWLAESDDDLVGHISINSTKPGYFDSDKASMYRTLVEQGTVALRAARLRDQVATTAERDRYRFELAEALAGNPTVEEVWDILLEKSLSENVSVALNVIEQLPDGDKALVTVRSETTTSDLPASPVGTSLKFSENPQFGDGKGGEFTINNNIHESEEMGPDTPLYKFLSSQGIVSLMSAPFATSEHEEWQAHMSINCTIPGYFTEDMVAKYRSLVELGTEALRSARLREQREAERERFETLVNYAPDAILMLNYETYMWMDANKNAEAMFGMSREELLKIGPGHVSPEFQPDGRESGEKAVELIGNAVTGGDLQFEWVHTDAAGRAFDCEIRLALLPGDEKELLVNITDITDRKQAQQAIVQGDKLKSEFLANMSHELRTPLNSILGYTDVLLMGLDGDLEEDVKIDLEAIHENSQHLLRLINDILDLAKIEAGRMTFSLGDVNVPQVLEELQRNNAGLLVGKDVELVVDVPEGLPNIVADERRVYQVINNLVSNAAKFTEKGSITMRAFEADNEMVLQVEDTGMGIDKENLDAIFEEFTQVDTSSTRQHEGTGLGLTITRRLVHMHGGTIGVDSEAGKGSVFTVRLPKEAKVDPELLSMVVSSPSANGSDGSDKKTKAKK
ncbi:MAG TPA: GAF domain-containing protein [Anaerolineales bacterium]|nr:GAF domain-containing protein [Anaerolineales bacterium]